jgi:diazepam-binding inhibitor (GABA receptor modulating acyl-CoA-binding protein)
LPGLKTLCAVRTSVVFPCSSLFTINFSLFTINSQKRMALADEFQSAVSSSQALTRRPSNEELLELYALYKQATEGDVSGDRPGGFDFKAIAKYDAWAEKKGLSKEQSMQDYVKLASRLKEQYS